MTPWDWYETVKADVDVILKKDPAATNLLEVLTCYPGLHALEVHRVAHELHEAGAPVLARMLSNVNRFMTGIEIHPGAKIGKGVFIDHGMGVVIGETAEVGDDVLLYQGVTLGGTSLDRVKRHPTIESGTVIGSGAKVLGSFTVGEGSYIGSGSVVTKAVPAHATVVGIPGRIAAIDGQKVMSQDLQHGNLPDPIMNVLATMQDRLGQLEAEVDRLRQENRELRQK
ncbi:MAG: serine O-acetyltransferase [Cyanobacteria bacterium RYN_339]|nr:serine O-acetyltransferase [Cyanobacteria bacterium RYN_339]